MPPGTATSSRMGSGFGVGWTVDSYLLADIFASWTGQQHPGRPKSATGESKYAQKRRALEEQRRRYANRS